MSTERPAGTGGLRVDAAGDPDAPIIVVVHGTMDRAAGLLRLSRRLAPDFHVVRYDRRGYGRSRHVGPPYTVAAHVDDLADVIATHAPRGRADLVFGHSFGGNVALGLASCRPELVGAVAVYETPLSWLDWWPGTTAGGAAIGADDAADAAEAFMRRLVGDDVWERLPGATRAARRAEGAAMVAELIDLRRAAPWDAGAIDVPVLAIVGEHGRPHHRRGGPTIADSIRGARFVELHGAGHGAPNSHPDDLADVLRAFLTDSGG